MGSVFKYCDKCKRATLHIDGKCNNHGWLK